MLHKRHSSSGQKVYHLSRLRLGLLFTGASLADRLIYYPFEVENGVEVENRGTLTNGELAGAVDAHVHTQLAGNDLGFAVSSEKLKNHKFRSFSEPRVR